MNNLNVDDWIEAGRRSFEVLNYAKTLVKEDKLVIDIICEIEEYAFKKDYDFAFPPQISINEIAAHYYPKINDKLRVGKDDILKIDVGIEYNGAIGDNALSVQLSKKNNDLLMASKIALETVTKELKVGMKVSEIGKIIEATIKSLGFKPVENLSGHGLGLYLIHCEPSIPNVNTYTRRTLDPGMAFAIEPFATNGKGEIKDSNLFATIFSLTQKEPQSQDLKEFYNYLSESFSTLPFSYNWLLNDYNEDDLNEKLNRLEREDVIDKYPPLIEVRKGLVSQHEYSFIVTEKEVIRITK
ncbi:MAG: type II methionyl aminopeptidase [Candidatus Nanoarchaeia archaeon]|nr:type II methionyl aminopeptidase [Candidatus Nanoarchaeia archaeon]